MNTILRPWVAAVLFGAALLTLQTTAVRCQEPVASDSAAQPETFRERTIYIPYEKLRKVFEARGRGVFLPYEEFQELWKAAREKRTPPGDQQSPVGAVISEVGSDGTVVGDVMQFTSRLKIELLRKGWHKVPLRLSDAAITRATLDGKPARIISDPRQGYLLLVERGEKAAEPIELELEFAKAIARSPGRNQVSVQVPQAPVSRWRITIPEPGVKVDIQPLLAASEVPESDKERSDEESKSDGTAGKTVVLAFVGAAPTVTIAWTPKTEGATGLTALAAVQSQQQVWINEGVMRTQCRLVYAISRARLASLAIAVPADQKVINVFDANVRQWSVAKEDGRQRIDVQLFEPAEGSQTVTVELEQFNDPAKTKTLAAPVVEALDVGRQQGLVVVQVSPALRAETSARTGLLQVDAAELPPALASGKWDFAYRYSMVPFELKLAIEKVEPRITVDSLVVVDLAPDRLTQSVWAVHDIQRAGVFRLEWDVPEGYEIREARGVSVAGSAASKVDDYQLTGDKKTRLVVNLASKAMGRTGLLLRLEKSLQCPELLTPPERPAQLDVVVPRVAGDHIAEDRGRLMVRAPESLRVNPAGPKGLRAVSFDEALKGMEGTDSASSGPLRHAFAFAFAREPVELAIAAERRKPQVIVGQLLTMKIEDDTVLYEAVFRYNILYSGVKSLRIDVPETLAGKLRNSTPGIRERVVEPAPDDLPKGYQAWSFSGETELVGEGQITLVWEEKLDKLGLGEEVKIEVPVLTPAKADDAPIDRAWGQIVLVKAETIDLAPSGMPEGLRPIDPQRDLAGGAKVADAASAFEFHGPWSLTVNAARYELQDVKYTIIENAVARMVVTRADQIAVQAVYRLRSGRQRLEVTLPKDVIFDTEPLRINGRPATLEKGGENQYFIPLTESSAERPLLVDLRYTLPNTQRAGGGQVLSLPEFPENPAILKVHLCAYLPDEQALIGVKGPWTNEIIWASDHTMNWSRPSYFHSDESLLEMLADGIPMTSKSTEGFETDGRRYVFSTLRPTGPLRLIDVNETALTAIVLAVLLLGGLVLAAASIKVRVLAVGGLITAVVLSGMFAPLFARQVLDGYFLAALVVVGVVWIAVMAIRLRPRRNPASVSPASTPQPPTSPPPTPASPAPTEAPAPADKSPDSPFAPPANQTHDDEGGKKDA